MSVSQRFKYLRFKDFYMKSLLRPVMILFLFFLMCVSSYAAVEVFSNYNTELTINKDNTIEVKKEMTLKNIHTVGIVPGSVEFKINKVVNNSVSAIEVENIKVTDRYGKDISHRVLETADYVIVALEIFTPVLPGFEYQINLEYKIIYDPSGLFFKNLEVPIKEYTTIPIEKGNLKMKLPSGYHYTYLSLEPESIDSDDKTAYWNVDKETPNTIAFEYSYLPIKIGDIRGSVVFWILINFLLVVLLFREIRKEMRRFKEVDSKKKK